VEGFATDVGFMIEKIKENYFVFIERKDKRYRYEALCQKSLSVTRPDSH
jgi:hypothetical protein